MASPPHVRVVDVTASGGVPCARVVVSGRSAPDRIAPVARALGLDPRVVARRVELDAPPHAVTRLASELEEPELGDAFRRSVLHYQRAPAAWHVPGHELPAPPLVMGIVNVTPDSFSNGGAHWSPEEGHAPAIAHGRRLLEEGAHIIDVGGESTRPGAAPVAPHDELERVLPVVAALAEAGAVVSIDTTKAVVAREAVAAGAAIVNDVSAGALDGALIPTVVELGCAYVLMHMRGTPRTMQRDPRYGDVVAEVFDFLADHVRRLTDLGVAPETVAVDPGIGFGKTLAHNLELLRRIREFTSLGRPVLVGASRKSFVGTLAGAATLADRDAASLAVAVQTVLAGAAVVRVHEVATTRAALRMAAALR